MGIKNEKGNKNENGNKKENWKNENKIAFSLQLRVAPLALSAT